MQERVETQELSKKSFFEQFMHYVTASR